MCISKMHFGEVMIRRRLRAITSALEGIWNSMEADNHGRFLTSIKTMSFVRDFPETVRFRRSAP